MLLTLAGLAVLLAGVIGGRMVRYRIIWVERIISAKPTVYQFAYLAGGERRVAETAACYLVWTGVFEARENLRRLVLTAPPERVSDLHWVEQAMVDVTAMEGTHPGTVLGAGRLAATTVAEQLPGVAVDWRTRARIAAIPVGVGTAVLITTAWWMFASIGRGEGVRLAPIVLLAAVGVVVSGFLDRPFATRLGERFLREARAACEPDLVIAANGVTSLSMAQGLLMVALFGRQAMTGGLAGLRNLLVR